MASQALPDGDFYLSARAEYLAIERELRRRRWLADPSLWVQERLGSHLWSMQRRIMESVRDHRKTAVPSCHGPGKSFTAATIVAWWIDTHRPGEAFVVTSAPTGRQVRAILWREINLAHARGGLPGRTNQTEWHITTVLPNGNEKEILVGFGQKPSDLDPTAFQGIHGRYVLVVLDEACGMNKELIDAAETLLTNDDCRELAIGNPDIPDSEFAQLCKPGSGWNVFHISAWDTPNFTGEAVPKELAAHLTGKTWVEEKRRKWARTWTWSEDGRSVVPPEGYDMGQAHPHWLSKVLGVFPPNVQEQGLIPQTWITAAQDRKFEPFGPDRIGMDVGAGGDATTLCRVQGNHARIIHEDHNPNTMETTGMVISTRKALLAQMPPGHEIQVRVDKIGIGAGVVDRANEQGEAFEGINVGEAPPCICPSPGPEELHNEKSDECPKALYLNKRAYYYWHLRELFEHCELDLDPEDDDLAAELCSLRYKRTSNGKIQIESKEDAKRRGFASPNRAEALMLACAPLLAAKPKLKGKLLW